MLRCLSVSGGGRLGALPSHIMDRLADTNFIRAADVLAGTSTGSIIACALAVGMTPAELSRLYDEECGRIFKRSWFAGYGAKYASDGLREILTEHFGNMTLGDLGRSVAIAVSRLGSDDVNTFDEPVLLANFNGNEGADWPCVDAIMASCAAPTYFAPVLYHGRNYADGGLWANDPSLDALVLASDAYDVPLTDCAVLSFGCGWRGYRSNPKWLGGRIQWLSDIVNWGVDATELATPRRLQHLLQDNYCHVQVELSREWQMDDCSPECIEAIREEAANYDLTMVKGWIERVWLGRRAVAA